LAAGSQRDAAERPSKGSGGTHRVVMSAGEIATALNTRPKFVASDGRRSQDPRSYIAES